VGAVLNNYQQVQEVEDAKRSKLDASDTRLKELIAEMNTIMKHKERLSSEKSNERVETSA
jgi:hypothetical protein